MSLADDEHEQARSTRGLSGEIVGARPDEPAALVLARARIAGALFGDGGGLGRFRVLERLGSGGMGAVYAAYDPQLDRGVALKMVHVPQRRHDAALAEAKALARLAHPNVVPVFDVGIDGDEVYIVMELVRGQTLRGWVKGRTIAEILEVYRQAGAALAAAHAAGLVHRDFKPDNAIVGVDGRVRVVDFGLARFEWDSEARAAAGTPGYMAPEQAAGGAVTAAADQFSFCVALGEALGGGELPAWLAAIVERGTAAQPAERFASMPELLRALGRDPARRRRRRIAAALIAAGGAASVAVAFVAGRSTLAADPAPCDGVEAELAAAWPAPARGDALARIAARGAYGSELAPRIAQQLDDHGRSWVASRRDACLSYHRGLQSAALFDRRMACLDRSRAALSAIGDEVARADASLPRLAEAVTALRSPSACSDAEVLLADVAPPPGDVAPRVRHLHRDLARIQVDIAAGRVDEVHPWIDAIVEQARAIAYPPLLAEALLVSGQRLAAAEDRDHAVPALREASRVAITGAADALAVEAWARWAQLTATSDRFARAEGREQIEAIAARTSCRGVPRAQLHATLGSVELARDQRAAAREAFAAARADLQDAPGATPIERAVIERGRALTTDDPGQRDDILAQLEATQTRLLGENHPQTLTTRYTRATTSVVGLAAAAATLDDTCAKLARHTSLRGNTARCWVALAEIQRDRGDVAGAAAALDEAERLDAGHNHFTPEALAYHALWRGDAAAAIHQFTAALAARPPRSGEPWFAGFERARLALGLARAQLDAGQPRDAARLRDVVAAIAAVAHEHPATTIDRLLARARTEYAYAAPHGDDRLAAARAALAWWRLAGGDPDDIAQLTALDSPR